MAADDFNDAGKKVLNEYNLKLTSYAGVTPRRGGKGEDREPMHQAALFCEKLGNWLEANGDYEKHNALTTEPLAPSPDGYPRMRIVCTAETMGRVEAQFKPQITQLDLVREDVPTRRIIKRPDAGMKPPKP
jgi:hypothetical protein